MQKETNIDIALEYHAKYHTENLSEKKNKQKMWCRIGEKAEAGWNSLRIAHSASSSLYLLCVCVFCRLWLVRARNKEFQ